MKKKAAVHHRMKSTDVPASQVIHEKMEEYKTSLVEEKPEKFDIETPFSSLPVPM